MLDLGVLTKRISRARISMGARLMVEPRRGGSSGRHPYLLSTRGVLRVHATDKDVHNVSPLFSLFGVSFFTCICSGSNDLNNITTTRIITVPLVWYQT